MKLIHSLVVAIRALNHIRSAAAAKSPLSIDSDDAIKKSAATIASDLLQYYHGNEAGNIPGLLPNGVDGEDRFVWYESAIMWQTLLDYWYYTEDSTYNNLVTQGLLFQSGDNDDFMPLNQTTTMGNDSQGLWALAALSAAEYGLPDPPRPDSKWINLAKNVWEELASREDNEDACGGGLRWMVAPFNKGYDYKSTLANGVFFSLSARLARFTGNKTYTDWADKTWNWMENSQLFDNKTNAIYDGIPVHTCEKTMEIEFSLHNAIFLSGASYLFNFTTDSKWENRASKLATSGLKTFFKDDIAFEVSCEKLNTCTNGMKLFKGSLHHLYATATQMMPSLAKSVRPVLQKSAKAAVSQCTGGGNSRQCGFHWSRGFYDGKTGARQEINVLGAVSSLLVSDKNAPATASTAENKTNQSADKGASESDDDQNNKTGKSPDESGENSAGRNIASSAAGLGASVVFMFSIFWAL